MKEEKLSELKEQVKKFQLTGETINTIKRKFNTSIALIAIIPSLVLLYIIVNQLGAIESLIGYVGCVYLIAVLVMVLGISFGRQLLWSLIDKLISMNKKLYETEQAIVEKEKMVFLMQASVGLNHKMNQPLTGIIGFAQILKQNAKDNQEREDLELILREAKKCKELLIKLQKVTKPVITRYIGKEEMLDIEKSIEKSLQKAVED